MRARLLLFLSSMRRFAESPGHRGKFFDGVRMARSWCQAAGRACFVPGHTQYIMQTLHVILDMIAVLGNLLLLLAHFELFGYD